MFPIELITFHVVFATTQTNSTESLVFVLAKEPVTPVVVFAVPKYIVSPAFCAIFHPPAPIPVTLRMLPTAAVSGKVKVTNEPEFVIYPELTVTV